jgi:c-di-GMP-related signal transduction protein
MTEAVQSPPCALAAAPEAASTVRYVARQPILDLRGKVHGYELLFRDGHEDAFSGDGDQATRAMLDNALLFGLGRLTCGLPAFVNCTTETLTGNLVHLLPSGMAVLEILESVDPSPTLIGACRELKKAGYRFALDDFKWRPGIEPLVDLASYIKVDFAETGPAERLKLLYRLRGVTVALVAEKIETQKEYVEARNEGFTCACCRTRLLTCASWPGRSSAKPHLPIVCCGSSIHRPAPCAKRCDPLKRRCSP